MSVFLRLLLRTLQRNNNIPQNDFVILVDLSLLALRKGQHGKAEYIRRSVNASELAVNLTDFLVIHNGNADFAVLVKFFVSQGLCRRPADGILQLRRQWLVRSVVNQ